MRESELATTISRVLRNEQGQDLVEYTLLLSFVVMSSTALFIGAGGSVATIWTLTNSKLANAYAAAK